MNHLKKFEELNQSTYLKAANKLRSKKHYKRANRMLKYVKGEGEPVNRLYVHGFDINDSEYFITDITLSKMPEDYFPSLPMVIIDINNKYGIKLKLLVIIGLEDISPSPNEYSLFLFLTSDDNISEIVPSYYPTEIEALSAAVGNWFDNEPNADIIEHISLNSRKDALELKKILISEYEDDLKRGVDIYPIEIDKLKRTKVQDLFAE